MKNNINIKNHFQKKHINNTVSFKFSKKFNKIIKDLVLNIEKEENIYSILNNNFNLNFKFAELRRFKKYKKIVIIGMGGSILGVEAIHSFLQDKVKKKVIFFNDINEDKILKFKKENKFSNTLFFIISKSGNTIETLTNFFSLNVLKYNKKNIIIISEKKNNVLFNLSKKFKLFYIEHKDFIGGRYSVLSEVGLIPSYLMGINIFKIRKNIKKYLLIRHRKFLKDSCIKLANIFQQRQIKSLIILNYDSKIEKFLLWKQQLIAESLGKNRKGLLPVVSNVPKDHHSLLQLYLDGPKDKIFNIFSINKKTKINIKTNLISKDAFFLKNKFVENIKMAQRDALTKTLKKNKFSFREFIIKNYNEETLGELFSYFILETIIIANLVKVNPFNQPAVEQVKVITKKILS